MDPIRSLITRSEKSSSIDKRLHQQQPMPIDLLPILHHCLDVAPQQIGGKTAHLYPGKDQEPIPVGDTMNVSPPLLITPADETVSDLQLQRRRSPSQGGNWPLPMEC
jgi:hypothetical protein